jgi:hypothetical protein
LEQEVQPDEDEPAKGFSTPLIPKTENFFVTSLEPHFGQETSFETKTRTSNSSLQAGHMYSKMGITQYNTRPAAGRGQARRAA